LEDNILYKKARAKASLQWRKMKCEGWAAFVKKTEHDMTGGEQMSLKYLKNLPLKKMIMPKTT
jgi:hypothetical protein